MTTSSRALPALLTAAAVVLVWTLLCALGAFGSTIDHQHAGDSLGYLEILWRWWQAHIGMMLFSCALLSLLSARPAMVLRLRPVAMLYLAVLLFFLPLELLYVGAIELVKADQTLTLAGVWSSTLALNKFGWFLEFTWTSFTFVTIVGICNLREHSARAAALQKAHADNLALRLELEEQRLLALRAQLEPHFIFNALNAISALVRSDDKRIALDGIGHLSDLLRYALQASEREMVSLADERRFIADYLALQKLRYGARLQVSIDGDDDALLHLPVPPLLLQPLIENALRHDLDCHDGASDIRLAFRLVRRAGFERLAIVISNPVGAARAANPGLGLGLRHSRARLQLIYGAAASLDTRTENGRFVVDIEMPRHAAA